MSEREVYAQLVSSWGKIDTAAREKVGSAGEEALVELLSENTDGRVEQVSSWSDGFGYDIAFSQGSICAHLEVKSTTRTGRFTAYLSRNECEVMLRDSSWVMVAVRLTQSLEVAGVGSVSKEWIIANLPRDSTASATWESCKLEVPAECIENQVLELGECAAAVIPPWREIAVS